MQQANPPHQPPGTHGFTEMVFPERTNHYGTLFGGQALLLMGQAAFVTASRHARRAVVMARCSGVDFLAPVPQGQALELQARVVRSGTAITLFTPRIMTDFERSKRSSINALWVMSPLSLMSA